MMNIWIALGIYLLVGWWDAVYTHYQSYRIFSWRWVNLTWPLRWWKELFHEYWIFFPDDRETLENALEMAWVLLANVDHGDWSNQDPNWIYEVEAWRDRHIGQIH